MSEQKRSKAFPVSIVFVVLLVGLGLLDALLIEKKILPHFGGNKQSASSASSVGSETSKGVRKASGPNVSRILVSQGFEIQDSDERTLTGQIIGPEDASVFTKILLKEGDRVGLISWVDSPDINRYFLALKEALHASFSPDVKDLVDEVQRREGKPARNLLSFLDTGLSEERIVFIRIRERLYELHVVEGHDQEMFDLVEELTQ